MLQLWEEKPRHGALPGLGSNQGWALGRLEIPPGVGWGSALWLLWEGCGLRGGEHGPGPRGVSCSLSRFLPGPAAGNGVSVSAGNQTGGREGPGTGGRRCHPRPHAREDAGMCKVLCCISHLQRGN